MNPDPGILTSLLNAFLGVFSAGPGNLTPAATKLLFLLGGIDLTLAALWWVLKGENVAVAFIQKILVITLFGFFVTSWPNLINSVLNGFIWSGFTAAGSSTTAGAALIKDPSAIISLSFVATQPIENEIAALKWYDLGSLFMLGWSYLFTILAFFMLGIQVFITYLEFYLVAALSLILVPFGVFKHTAFIAERAFGSVISFGVKLMVLSFILAAAQPVVASITLPTNPTLQQAYMVLLAALAICFLAWHAPGIAAGMISGGPSLTAGSAAGFAASSLIGAFAGAAAASGAVRGAADTSLGATKAAAGALGTASAGARIASATAQLGGSGVAGQIAAGVGGAGSAVVRSAVVAGTRPVSAVASSIAESFRRGEVRAWNPRAQATTPPTSEGTTFSRVQSAMRAANTIRSTIPSESHGGVGLSAPIRPNE